MRLRLVSSLLLLAAACGGSSDGSTQPAPVATITVTLGSASVGAGLTTNATAVLRDASGKRADGPARDLVVLRDLDRHGLLYGSGHRRGAGNGDHHRDERGEDGQRPPSP